MRGWPAQQMRVAHLCLHVRPSRQEVNAQFQTTVDLVQTIMGTREPGRTRLLQAWRRLQEIDRQSAISPTVAAAGPGGIRALKHKWAVEAVQRYGKGKVAYEALGISKF